MVIANRDNSENGAERTLLSSRLLTQMIEHLSKQNFLLLRPSISMSEVATEDSEFF